MNDDGEITLFDEVMRFLYEIADEDLNPDNKQFVYIPNGSTGLGLAEQIYNILRHYSIDKEEREGKDEHIVKPCEIASLIIQSRLDDQNREKK